MPVVVWYSLTTQWHAWLLADAGDLEAAENEARLGITSSTATERWMRALPIRTLVAVLLDRGQTREAIRLWRELEADGDIPSSRPLTPLLLVRARLREAVGDGAGALADADEAARRVSSALRSSIADQEIRLLRARLAHNTGAADLSQELLATADRVAAAWDTAGAVGRVLRLRGRVDRDADLLRAAAYRLGDSPLRLEHAHTLADLGAALRRAGHRRDARTPLHTALEAARACGADGLEATVAEELAATGARVIRPRSNQGEDLTPTERRISRLAAEGATNKEIAQKLFISVKTVEMHLGNAYRKLDVSSRRELAGRLALRRA